MIGRVPNGFHLGVFHRTRLLKDSYLPVHSWSGVPYEGCTAIGVFAYIEPGPIYAPTMSKDESRKELTKFLRNQSPSLEIKQAIARLCRNHLRINFHYTARQTSRCEKNATALRMGHYLTNAISNRGLVRRHY